MEVSREEFEKVKKEVKKKFKEVDDNLGKLNEYARFNFTVTKSLVESMSKLLKMLRNPDYEGK